MEVLLWKIFGCFYMSLLLFVSVMYLLLLGGGFWLFPAKKEKRKND